MEKQRIADLLTNEILSYFFGDKFRDCDCVEDDYEMNHAWEYFNDILYAELDNFEKKLHQSVFNTIKDVLKWYEHPEESPLRNADKYNEAKYDTLEDVWNELFNA
jgi:hypothetical protein